ncbi:hypothetical protein OAN21_01890 [Alphaproteobacteria bacterium]|nr:hypothetical protein [Alphaproteobacteria bacterium]
MKFFIIMSIGFLGFVSVSAASTNEQRRNAEIYSSKALMKKRETLTRILSKISSKEDKKFVYFLWLDSLYHERGVSSFLFKKGKLTRGAYQEILKKIAREHHVAAKALKKMGFDRESQEFKELGDLLTKEKRNYGSSDTEQVSRKQSRGNPVKKTRRRGSYRDDPYKDYGSSYGSSDYAY